MRETEAALPTLPDGVEIAPRPPPRRDQLGCKGMKMSAEVIDLGEQRIAREMLCLDDVWNACGRKRFYKPSTWIRCSGKGHIDYLVNKKGFALDDLIRVVPSGRVYACEDVAMSYGQDVDPDFTFMVINVVGFHAGWATQSQLMKALAVGQRSPAYRLINSVWPAGSVSAQI
jgi:hypothetical protein